MGALAPRDTSVATSLLVASVAVSRHRDDVRLLMLLTNSAMASTAKATACSSLSRRYEAIELGAEHAGIGGRCDETDGDQPVRIGLAVHERGGVLRTSAEFTRASRG
jgi:hypothetical protein